MNDRMDVLKGYVTCNSFQMLEHEVSNKAKEVDLTETIDLVKSLLGRMETDE